MRIVSLNLLAAMGKKTAPCVKCYFLCVYTYTYMFFTCNKFSISMRCVLRTPFSSSVRRSLNRTSQPSVQVGLFLTSVPISPSGSPWVDRKRSKRGKPQPVYGKTLCPCQTCLNCNYFHCTAGHRQIWKKQAKIMWTERREDYINTAFSFLPLSSSENSPLLSCVTASSRYSASKITFGTGHDNSVWSGNFSQRRARSLFWGNDKFNLSMVFEIAWQDWGKPMLLRQ